MHTVFAALKQLPTEPMWRESQLGKALPEHPDAVSVCLPTWDSVVGYLEKRDKVLGKLELGYPRFFRHPLVERLNGEFEEKFCMADERGMLFPHKAAAQRALRFVEKSVPKAVRIIDYHGLYGLVMHQGAFEAAAEYWRYAGEIVSSRQARDVLNGEERRCYDTTSLRAQLAKLGAYRTDDVSLYETGMSAVFAVHRAVTKMRPSKKTLQLDFPYVDVLRVQNHFGSGAVFSPQCEGVFFEEAVRRIRSGEFAAVFCEVPSNPLMHTVDLGAISKACRQGSTPLVIDDTSASVYNVDASRYADIVVSSLTKWISSKGNVMGGCVQLVEDSAFYEEFAHFFQNDTQNGSVLYAADAAVLDKNIIGYEQRMEQTNATTLQVLDYLENQPLIAEVWHPMVQDNGAYEEVKREGRGYGGLISFTLSQEKKTPKFYDALEVSKGPSFGNDFSMACPFTMLAHYQELDWASGCGVPSHLIRLSIGSESAQEIIERFETAFAAIS